MSASVRALIETPAHKLTASQRGERRLWAAINNVALMDEHRIRRAQAKYDRQNAFWEYL